MKAELGIFSSPTPQEQKSLVVWITFLKSNLQITH